MYVNEVHLFSSSLEPAIRFAHIVQCLRLELIFARTIWLATPIKRTYEIECAHTFWHSFFDANKRAHFIINSINHMNRKWCTVCASNEIIVKFMMNMPVQPPHSQFTHSLTHFSLINFPMSDVLANRRFYVMRFAVCVRVCDALELEKHSLSIIILRM